MADYFLVLDAAEFEDRVRPALAACRRLRTFAPCRPLCAEWTAAARAYAERYHVGGDEPMPARVAAGLPFDRDYWRALVAEVLLYTALEIPEFQTCEDALSLLLDPTPVRQAHHGTRDLTFGAAVYRPEQAGCNNVADVARLADYLSAARPESWTPHDLIGLPGAPDDADRDEELAYAREWFPSLADLFRRTRERGGVLVHERIF